VLKVVTMAGKRRKFTKEQRRERVVALPLYVAGA
jgi:hypothetical protein